MSSHPVDRKAALRAAACLLMIASSAVAQEKSLATPASRFREVMAIAGWTSAEYAVFADDRPLGAAAEAELAKLFLRLKSIPAAKLAEWARRELDAAQMLAEPAASRGELFRLSGHVVRVIEQRPAKDSTTWYQCDIRLDRGTMVQVLVPSIPAAWLKLAPLEQPVTCEAVFLRRTAAPNENGQLQFVAPGIAWYPNQVQLPEVNFGMTLLSSLGVNLTEWESIDNSGSLEEKDYEAFYQTLAAMRKTEAAQLVQLARANLSSYAAPFRAELAQLDQRSIIETQRGLVLTEIVTAADEGRYSVLPLFLEPVAQRGELVVLDGVVRRAVRVDTSINRDGELSRVIEQFGVDHYYELELFTADSQNLPLVFCVLQLPEDFPTGENLHEPVRVAGFFFKTWHYRGRRAFLDPADNSALLTPAARQAAPLLIGRAPLRVAESPAAAPTASGGLLGGLVALAILGIGLAAWFFSRGDRKFERTTLVKYQAPSGPLRIEVPEPPSK